MAKKEVLIPKRKLELYDKLIASIPEIERKGVTNPYTSVNGNMFTHLSSTGTLGLRLSKDDRQEFLDNFKTTLYESHGAVMKEYVTVPEDLFENTDELSKYLKKSYEYTKTLKPKATKRKSW